MTVIRRLDPKPPTNINEGQTMKQISRLDGRIDAQFARTNYIDDVVVKHVDDIARLKAQIDTLKAQINALNDLIESQGERITGVGEIAALNASGLARVARSGVYEADPVQTCEDAWQEAFGDPTPQYETNIRGGSATTRDGFRRRELELASFGEALRWLHSLIHELQNGDADRPVVYDEIYRIIEELSAREALRIVKRKIPTREETS